MAVGADHRFVPVDGSRLLELRQNIGLTQAKLAEETGLSDGEISDIESGRRFRVRARTLKALAGFFDVPLSTLTADFVNEIRPPTPHFVGRKSAIRKIRRELELYRSAGIFGMLGVGKTECAIKIAHYLRRRYPNQLFVNLRGTTDQPLAPQVVLARWIQLFRPDWKTESQSSDNNLEQLRSLYLRALRGRPVLIVLDNARDEEQVKSLVPPESCALLVTSRNVLPLTGQVILNELLPREAITLLSRAAHRVRSGPGREIAQLCGYLPEFLCSAAGILNQTPDLNPASYANQLRDERERLTHLGHTNAVFNISYEYLKPESKRVLLSMTAFRGSFDDKAEEYICQDRNHDELTELLTRSLVLYDGKAGRYRLHDLMRVFLLSAKGADSSVRNLALRLHARHYLDVLSAANKFFKQGAETAKEGLLLFDLERSNINDGQAWAAHHFQLDEDAAELCSSYPSKGLFCLNLRQSAQERVTWLEDALAAARLLHDRRQEAAHLGDLGIAKRDLGLLDEAIKYFQQELTLWRDLEKRNGPAQSLQEQLGQGKALGNLGRVHLVRREFQQAKNNYIAALRIARKTDQKQWAGVTLTALGSTYLGLGFAKRAMFLASEGLKIATEIRDRRGEAMALDCIGSVLMELHQFPTAIEQYEEALVAADELGDQRGKLRTLINLASAWQKSGNKDSAATRLKEALKIAEDIKDPRLRMIQGRLAQLN